MEKKKLLKRLSALGFAMYECRLYCDTHPNDTEALQMLNEYKSKYCGNCGYRKENNGSFIHNKPPEL